MERELSRAEEKVMGWLIMMFNMVVIALGVLTMLYVMFLIIQLAYGIIEGMNVEAVLQGIVLILIFLEIFGIIWMYFRYHHVSMKNVVEIGVLAMVKELLITLDLQAFGWETLLAVSALIAAMGSIYVLEMKRIDKHEEFLLEHGEVQKEKSEP
jgi:uncharacterized membrane protein (DUF373 family)